MGKQKRIIKKIRKMIPDFDCLPGCSGCCGPISMSEWEAKQIDYIEIDLEGDNIGCPYLKDNRCSIYNDRPIICRLFGTIQILTCPHGCAPEKMLTALEEINLIKEWIKLPLMKSPIDDFIVKVREVMKNGRFGPHR